MQTKIIPDVIVTDIDFNTIDSNQFAEGDFVREPWGNIYQRQPNDGGSIWWRCHREPVMLPFHELGKRWVLRPHWEEKQILPLENMPK